MATQIVQKRDDGLMATQIVQKRVDGAPTAVDMHQTIVWIDAQEARIMRVGEGVHHDSTIYAPDARHTSKGHNGNEGTTDDSNTFFEQVARALDAADEILVVGPCATKAEFVKYMHKNDHAIDPRILGVETVAQLDDEARSGFTKLYFTVGGPRRNGNGSGYRVMD